MHQIKFWAEAKYAPNRFLTVVNQASRIAVLLIFCVACLSWAVPAQAASRIPPRLEEQVLQIIREHPEVLIESVQAYQQEQQSQRQQAQQAFLQVLKTNTQALIGESPTTGAESSKVVLVEFSDFQCPYCAQAHNTLKQFVAKHPEVLLVYKQFPLQQIHAEAMPAALAAWAAGKQGKFWEYQDALFTQQDKLGEELYLSTAKTLNLDLEKFNSDRHSKEAIVAIGQDIQLAQSIGLSGTPVFVMSAAFGNSGRGEIFSGAPGLSDMESIFESVSKA